MSILSDGVARARQFLRSLGRHDWAPGRTAGGDGVYARANPEAVEVTEEYFYAQEISRNPHKHMTQEPSGTVRIRVPYDGHEFFTQQACADVAVTANRRAPKASALIGHLLVANHSHTDLGSVLGLGQGYGSLPIRVPVTGAPGIDSADDLRADRQACLIEHDYLPDPDQLRVIPVAVDVELIDPDSLDSHRRTASDAPPTDIMQQVSFRSYLLLAMTVRVMVPKPAGADSDANHSHDSDTVAATVANMSLHWPTITSLRKLVLEVRGHAHPFRYNPLKRSIEWSDVHMKRVRDEDGDLVTFVSPPMFLKIEQPGELYQQPYLDGAVEVRVDNQLLSGTEVRLADGTGHIPWGRQPECVSHIFAELRLMLDDAFAKRMLTPFQHLHFDEVIPDEMRVSDIVSALKDRGFRVEDDFTRPDAATFPVLLRASRPEGPDDMVLWLMVDGRKVQTERENKTPGGQTYTTQFDSGELKVYIGGSLRRDSHALTREMNVLQQALRERFDRVRSIR